MKLAAQMKRLGLKLIAPGEDWDGDVWFGTCDITGKETNVLPAIGLTDEDEIVQLEISESLLASL